MPPLRLARSWIAALVVLVGLTSVASVPRVAAESASKAKAAELAAFNAAFNPDADHMGSTIRAHEPAEAGSGAGARSAAPQAMARAAVAQPYGMDVSAYQGNVDWATAARNGGRFAYVKATESTAYINRYFAQQYNGSAAAGMFRGAYHFALPNRSSGAAQANYFVDHGGGWSADGRTLPPMLDIEYNPYGPTCYSMSGSAMSAWIADFSRTVLARTGRYPTIYSTRNWWNSCTGSNGTFGSTHPLFIANYSSSPGAMPAGWGFHTLWQFNDRGTFPGDQDVFNGSETQLATFARGPADAPSSTVSPIAARYAALGGSRSFLGAPVGSEYAVPGGSAQNYASGRMYYSAATGVHEVHGAILDRYLAFGGPAGILGLPVTDETPTPDRVGRYNHFSGVGGSIYWTRGTGAHEIQGAIRDKWASLGWERSVLGYPTTDESPAAGGGGRFNNFSGVGGSIYWSLGTGAHEIQGAIRTAWTAMGGTAGVLGYPVTDENPTPSGVGRYNHFVGHGGSIYWTRATGAHEIQGAIRAKWASLGWERGVLGYPTTDESPAAGGGGRFNNFSGVGGSVYWSPATGAHEIQGAIRAEWLSLGGSGGALGFPTSDEYGVPDGRRSDFDHGSAVYSFRTRVVTVTLDPDATPEPTPTPTPEPTQTPEPTPTPEPTQTPEPAVSTTPPPSPTASPDGGTGGSGSADSTATTSTG